jgi:hypothetical protein
MNKTAMQWFYDELSQCLHREEVCDLVYKLEQKAKEMEREQIVDAHITGYIIGGGEGDLYQPENYYNETYGGKDE